MTYSFSEKIFEQGKRYFIKIPFNTWDECGQKGLIPVKVCIQGLFFECRLVPKGAGVYFIPIIKSIASQIGNSDEISLSFELISGLNRINHDSPYTLEKPIRKIDTVQNVIYHKDGYCGQICLAMLTGLSVDDIIDIMQAKAWQCSISKLIETLDYFGISHNEKVIYTRGKEIVLPECCIVNVKNEPLSHLSLYYKGKFYDSMNFGVDKIISYLVINI